MLSNLLNFFVPKTIVGKAMKITELTATDPNMSGYVTEAGSYYKVGDYFLWFGLTVTVVPADEFQRYFIFTEVEVPNKPCNVRQIAEF